MLLKTWLIAHVMGCVHTTTKFVRCNLPTSHPGAVISDVLQDIRAQKQSVQLASYDERLLAAARLLEIVEWSESQ
jgi:hypothetical protein